MPWRPLPPQGIGGAHLQAGKILHFGDRLVVGHKVAVAIFRVHDGFQADVIGDF